MTRKLSGTEVSRREARIRELVAERQAYEAQINEAIAVIKRAAFASLEASNEIGDLLYDHDAMRSPEYEAEYRAHGGIEPVMAVDIHPAKLACRNDDHLRKLLSTTTGSSQLDALWPPEYVHDGEGGGF